MERKFFYRGEIIREGFPIDKVLLPVVHRERAKKRIGQMANNLAPVLHDQLVTFVTLGDGANIFHTRLVTEKTLEKISWNHLHINARGSNGTTHLELIQEVESMTGLSTKFADTGTVVVVAEVRYSGQSLSVMTRHIKSILPEARVVTICLIDRTDCVERYPQFNIPLDFTGFRVRQSPVGWSDYRANAMRQGWLVGFGMAISNRYRSLKTIHWTIVEPDGVDSKRDMFFRPRTDELPQITVPISRYEEPLLEEWDKSSSRLSVAANR